MGRILSIDYGKKRVGLAVTDPLQISINPIPTIPTDELLDFLVSYIIANEIGDIVIGFPRHKDGNPTALVKDIIKVKEFIVSKFPQIVVTYQDESYTSAKAKELIFVSGVKKKKRRDKALVDQMSAVIILKEYMESV